MKEESLFHASWQSDISFQKDALKSVRYLEKNGLVPLLCQKVMHIPSGFPLSYCLEELRPTFCVDPLFHRVTKTVPPVR